MVTILPHSGYNVTLTVHRACQTNTMTTMTLDSYRTLCKSFDWAWEWSDNPTFPFHTRKREEQQKLRKIAANNGDAFQLVYDFHWYTAHPEADSYNMPSPSLVE